MSVNLKRIAYEQLRTDLLNGSLPAGATLSAVAVAKRLGISHTPVREALCQLETEGFVEQVPRLGHQVKAISRGELADLFELRQFLEQGAVAKAAERITQAEIEHLWDLCAHCFRLARVWRDATDPDEIASAAADWTRLDAVFHMRLLTAAGNNRLVKLASDLQLSAFLFRRHVEVPRDVAMARVAKSYRDHCHIVRALERRDAQAAVDAARHHLEGAKSYYLEAFDNSRRRAAVGANPDVAWASELLASIDAKSSEVLPPVPEPHRRRQRHPKKEIE